MKPHPCASANSPHQPQYSKKPLTLPTAHSTNFTSTSSQSSPLQPHIKSSHKLPRERDENSWPPWPRSIKLTLLGDEKRREKGKNGRKTAPKRTTLEDTSIATRSRVRTRENLTTPAMASDQLPRARLRARVGCE